MKLQENVQALNQLILEGKVEEAFERFYHPEVVRQENYEAPRVGKAFNLEYERKAIARVEKWHKVEILEVALNEEKNISMVVQLIEVTLQGKRFRREEVAVQKWQDDLIIHEKFYYTIEALS